ncbi:phosphotriesterase-related protein [Lycorma delicatula]|uniref:phosphotriesterase-related protein n=1 Tax=Lycorma delicatula TaxID=130591 RepID=UPI003F50E49E
MAHPAVTVLGPVPATQLGRTLTHEHFGLNFEKFYVKPPSQLESYIENKISLENVGFIRQYPYSSRSNIKFSGNDVDNAIVEEMHMYKKFGGGTIIENTNIGLDRNVPLMVKASKETGVHVVAGTGFYVSAVQSQSVLHKSVEEMCNDMRNELQNGCLDYESVKCGFIGEVGSSWPIDDFERRAIQATAEVQTELDCAVSFHPAREPKAPFEIMRIFLEAGGNANRTIMSHLDRTIGSEEQLLEFASFGTFCQFDLFGVECSYYQLKPLFDMRSDAQRIDQIHALIHHGKESKILLSHDIHTKHRLVKFGGHGFSHILNNVKEKMLIKGISENTAEKILTRNPAKWLCG